MAVFGSTAHVYDLIYEAAGKEYGAEALEIRALVAARRPDARSLLDVACGTGAHLAHFREWFDVVGLDVDPGMLSVARARLPGARLVEADMRSFELGRRFDVVVCLFSSIGYMPSSEDLDTAIATMGRHLGEGGVLVVDGWVRPECWFGEGVRPQFEIAASEEVTVVRCVRAERAGNATHLEMHHLVATLDGVQYLVDEHDLMLFERTEYVRGFERAGLEVEVLPSPYPDRDRYVGVKISGDLARSWR